MEYRGDDFGSIVGGLLSGFSNMYFPLKERRRDDELARERLDLQREQNSALNQLRQDEAGWKNFERAMKIKEMQREDEWSRAMLGGGGGYDAPRQAPQIARGAIPQAPAIPAPQAESGAPIWQRNNNPGNLRVPGRTEFQSFPDLDAGVAAMAKQLRRYGGRGINTIRNILKTYAPPTDGNNTDAYVGMVAKGSGFDPDAPLDLNDPQMLAKVMTSMISVETGRGEAVPKDMIRRAVGLGPQVAQAGQQTATDATDDPIRRFTSMDAVSAERFILSAPKTRREDLRALWKAANKNDLTGEAKNFELLMGRKPTVEEYLNFKRQGAASTTINVGQKKFDEKLAEKWTEDYATLFQDAKTAQGVLANLDAAQAVMESGLQTGALEPAKAQISALARGLNIDPKRLGLEDASTPQAFQAVVMRNLLNELVMQKGPQTEGDAQRAMKVFMSLGNTPEANKFILDYARQMAQRKIDMANHIYNAGLEKYDGDSFRATQDWQEYIKDKPFQFNTEVLSTSPATAQAPPEGSTVRKKADGRLYKIVNGQLVPLE